MKIKQILQDNPAIADELEKFFTKELLESVENNDMIPTSFKDLLLLDGINEKLLLTYLEATPALICNFMDEHEIIILTTHSLKNKFSFTINGIEHKEFFKTRKKAELEAVVQSIIYFKEGSKSVSDENVNDG